MLKVFNKNLLKINLLLLSQIRTGGKIFKNITSCTFIMGYILVFTACETSKKNDLYSAESLFEKIQTQSKRGYYPEALQNILKLKHLFPYHLLTAKASLMRGDIFFDQEMWEEALIAYSLFIDLYPKHEKAEYALYRKVLSWDEQIPKVADRDLSISKDVFLTIKEFINKFPKSSYKEEIIEIKDSIYNRLAEKELEIVKYYYKKKQYQASLSRLNNALAKYAKSHWYKETLETGVNIANKTNQKKWLEIYLKKLKNLL